MAAPGRRTNPALEDEPVDEALFDRGYEFEFFQAVRLLLRVFRHRKQVGSTAKPHEEVARFAGQVSLAFPASAVDTVDRPGQESPQPRMTVAFLGLAGVQGVLPLHYTERILARRTAHDTGFAAFLDIFNHRFISHFYRAWEKHRPAVLLEAARVRRDEIDPFTQCLFDLVGMGTRGLRGRMRIHDHTLLLYGGLIAQRPRSASAVRAILRDYFGLPVEVAQFQGRWYPLEEPDRSHLRGDLERIQLGVGTFIGSKVWDQQAHFRVRLGPLNLEQFCAFLPGSDSLARVIEFTRFLVGQGALFDVQVVLAARAVPFARLSDRGADAPRLGWMGWLKTREFVADADDALFRADARWTAGAVQ